MSHGMVIALKCPINCPTSMLRKLRTAASPTIKTCARGRTALFGGNGVIGNATLIGKFNVFNFKLLKVDNISVKWKILEIFFIKNQKTKSFRMAMQGITLTIAPVQEMVWRRIYVELGLTNDEIADHFSGPAFLAWQRMGLLRGFAGPLPISYMNRSSSLQKQIISAYRDLGIAFALPAFAGHVPRSFKRIFPNATFSSMRTMYKFSPKISLSLIIDPMDPLFKKVGKLFLSRIIEEYGEGNHIYFSDPFNKNDPTNQTIAHVSNVSKMVYKTMKEIDPHAIWLLQAWVFLNPIWSNGHRKALLTAVPTGRILVLDLHAEILPQYTTTKSFHGQPFIWCMLHNFGGALGMHGSFEVVNQVKFNIHQSAVFNVFN